jgi:hypothetical protein
VNQRGRNKNTGQLDEQEKEKERKSSLESEKRASGCLFPFCTRRRNSKHGMGIRKMTRIQAEVLNVM